MFIIAVVAAIFFLTVAFIGLAVCSQLLRAMNAVSRPDPEPDRCECHRSIALAIRATSKRREPKRSPRSAPASLIPAPTAVASRSNGTYA